MVWLNACFLLYCYRIDLTLEYPRNTSRIQWQNSHIMGMGQYWEGWDPWNKNIPITALNLRTLYMHQGLFNGLLYEFNKLQDRPACQMSNVWLQLLDLARFRTRLVWSGNSAPGSLQALTHLWQQNTTSWLKGFLPQAMCWGAAF